MEGGAAKIEHSRFRVARNLLLFWTLYVGLGAVAGAVGMLADPSGKAMGMDAMLPCFQKLPFADVLFSDLLFSGIALLIVNGITNLTAAGLLLAKKTCGHISWRLVRRDADALDPDPVLYVPAEFYVHGIFYFRISPSGDGVRGVGV